MPSSNHGRTSGNLTEFFCGFTQYLQARLRLGHYHSLASRFQFITSSALRICRYRQRRSQNHRKLREQNILDIKSDQGKARNALLYSRILVVEHVDRNIAELPAICLSSHMWKMEFTAKEDQSPNNKRGPEP